MPKPLDNQPECEFKITYRGHDITFDEQEQKVLAASHSSHLMDKLMKLGEASLVEHVLSGRLDGEQARLAFMLGFSVYPNLCEGFHDMLQKAAAQPMEEGTTSMWEDDEEETLPSES